MLGEMLELFNRGLTEDILKFALLFKNRTTRFHKDLLI